MKLAKYFLLTKEKRMFLIGNVMRNRNFEGLMPVFYSQLFSRMPHDFGVHEKSFYPVVETLIFRACFRDALSKGFDHALLFNDHMFPTDDFQEGINEVFLHKFNVLSLTRPEYVIEGDVFDEAFYIPFHRAVIFDKEAMRLFLEFDITQNLTNYDLELDSVLNLLRNKGAIKMQATKKELMSSLIATPTYDFGLAQKVKLDFLRETIDNEDNIYKLLFE